MRSPEDDSARWEGRNENKDSVRERIWRRLEDEALGIGPVTSRIPNFVGADLAAEMLATLPAYLDAEVVKVNPDPAQAWVRLDALQRGKIVYTPIPELTLGLPFVELDPRDLAERGIRFEAVMFSEAFVEACRHVEFDEIPHIDIAVVGSVATTHAGARIGKGGGFADLEFGVFHELGVVDDATTVATTVHDVQVVDDDQIHMLAHDTPLDVIATPTALHRTETQYPVPVGVDWSNVRADQFADIPFLSNLRDSLTERADAGG